MAEYPNTPKYAGSINLNVGEEDDTITLGLMQDFIVSEGDAWNSFLKEIDGVFSAIDQKKIELESIEDVVLYKKN